MWVLAIIIAVLVAIVAGVLIAAMFRPKEFRVERSILSTASANDIYAVFSDLHRWREWSPFDKRDPAMKVEYSGPAVGAGSSYSWNGNNQVGSGRLTIVRAEPDKFVELKLEFSGRSRRLTTPCGRSMSRAVSAGLHGAWTA